MQSVAWMKRCFLLLFIVLGLVVFSAMAQSPQTMKYLALGDSYTIGESVTEQERWPVLLARALKLRTEPTIIATTGWRTDDLMKAINAATLQAPYDLVSLLIGVNNQYQGKSVEAYQPEFEELVLKAITLAGGENSRVFVVSIPDYGFTPFGKQKQENITTAIDAFNAANKLITERHGVRYINITDISRRGFDDPELVAPDGLHPSGKQYSLWVERIIRALGK
jgi:lysophospholipase L1-like esterase